MTRDEVLAILSQNRDDLRVRFGVESLALFGSMARDSANETSDSANETSDVDLLVEFNRPTGYFGLFALQDHLESILGCPVDLGTRESLKSRLRAEVLRECIDVA